MKNSLQVQKYFEPSIAPQSAGEQFVYDSKEQIQNQKSYIEAQLADVSKTKQEKDALQKQLDTVKTNLEKLNTGAGATDSLKAMHNADGTNNHGSYEQQKLYNQIASQKNAVANTTDTAKSLADNTQATTEVQQSAKNLVEKHDVDTKNIQSTTQSQTANEMLTYRVENSEITKKQLDQWLKEAEQGSQQSGLRAAFALFSDFDGKYMPNVPFLKWAGLNGAVVEKSNKVRAFGPDSQKQSI